MYKGQVNVRIWCSYLSSQKHMKSFVICSFLLQAEYFPNSGTRNMNVYAPGYREWEE